MCLSQLLVCILPYLKGLDYEVIANKMGSGKYTSPTIHRLSRLPIQHPDCLILSNPITR